MSTKHISFVVLVGAASSALSLLMISALRRETFPNPQRKPHQQTLDELEDSIS